jgi:hypothetical protein
MKFVLFCPILFMLSAPTMAQLPDQSISCDHQKPSEKQLKLIGFAKEDKEQVKRVQNLACKAINTFKSKINTNAPVVTINKNPESCLRTGFHPESRQVKICRNEHLTSDDILNHEIFHALSCQTKPSLCSKEALKETKLLAISEGMADYFSYLLIPDTHFANNLHSSTPLRSYKTNLCFSLAAGAHAKGNSIVSALIDLNKGYAPLRSFFSAGTNELSSLLIDDKNSACFAPAPVGVSFKEEILSGHAPSRLKRYRLSAGEPLKIKVSFNQSFTKKYPLGEVSVTVSSRVNSLFSFTASKKEDGVIYTWQVNKNVKKGFEKRIIEIRYDNKTIGFFPIYLSVKR